MVVRCGMSQILLLLSITIDWLKNIYFCSYWLIFIEILVFINPFLKINRLCVFFPLSVDLGYFQSCKYILMISFKYLLPFYTVFASNSVMREQLLLSSSWYDLFPKKAGFLIAWTLILIVCRVVICLLLLFLMIGVFQTHAQESRTDQNDMHGQILQFCRQPGAFFSTHLSITPSWRWTINCEL